MNAESWPSHDEPIGNLWKWLGYEMPLKMWVGHEERLAMQTLVSQKGAIDMAGPCMRTGSVGDILGRL